MQQRKNLFIADVCALHHHYGGSAAVDPKMYINADMVFSIDFLPAVAKHITDIILAVSGNFKKCLIMDLDNTIWGGIIGDDGIENIQVGDLGIGKAFTEVQAWIKQLKQRGIILAVCSKNDGALPGSRLRNTPTWCYGWMTLPCLWQTGITRLIISVTFNQY